MTIELVIFDCDGVLVDTEPRTEKVMARNLARYGFDMHDNASGATFVGGTMKGIADTLRAQGVPLPSDWLDEIYGEMYADLATGVDVIPGVPELVAALHDKGTALAIASNGQMAKMRITLPPSGLWDTFEGRIFSGYEHPPKPAPEMLWRACQQAGVSVSRAVFVDDSPTGCRAAQNAGMTCLGFAATGNGAELSAVGALPMADMNAVAGWLGVELP